jgi:DNA-directed RNA polymerase subunit M/transcription elongation factor TFIIS
MNDFRIKNKHQHLFFRIINKIRNFFSSLKSERKNQRFIIKRVVHNQTENNNIQSITNTSFFRIKNIKHNNNTVQSGIMHQKIVIRTDKQNDRPKLTNPKRCPLCGSMESAYQRVVLRENDRWKCAICGNTW